MREDERGPLRARDDVGDGEGLAGAGNAEEDLVIEALLHATDEFLDGIGLIAGWLEFGGEFEGRHGDILSQREGRGRI